MEEQLRFCEVMVTPELAQKYLEKNIGNRQIKLAQVNKLVDAINRGEWMLNPQDAITISKSGRLLNGQHRLTAIIKSGIPCPCLVCSGVDDNLQLVMDQGSPRTAADTLGINTVRHATRVSAGIRKYIYLCKTNGVACDLDSRTPIASNRQIYDVYYSAPDFWNKLTTWALRLDAKDKGRLALVPAGEVIGFSAYLIKKLDHPEDRVFYFFDQLNTTKQSPNRSIELLRTRLIHNAISQTKMTRTIKTAMLAKAWNCYYTGQAPKILRIQDKEEVCFI